MPGTVTLEALVQSIQFKDPRMYDLLRGIISQLRKLNKDVEVLSIADLPADLGEFPSAPLVFTFELRARSVHFEWTQPSLEVVQYELRKGTDWDTADRILITSTLSADVDPLTVGTHTYLLKSIDTNGTYSVDPAQVSVEIHKPGGVTITTQIIDNNVLLSWTNSVSPFTIAYYEVKRDSTVIGNINGTFTAIFEAHSGSYSYTVTPVDIAGNRGIAHSVTAEVSQPTDFELTDSYTSTLNGTRTDVYLFESRLVACIDTSETWQDWLDAHPGWTTFQDEIDNYPYWFQPTLTTGSYEETYDFGSTYTNVIATVDWDFNSIVDLVSVAVTLEGSTDGSTWGTPISGITGFFPTLRYIRVTLDFSSGDDESLLELFNLRFVLDVKREVDSGLVSAVSTDVGGTTVSFNKSFKDVDSITLTPLSTTACFAIYDFVDAPNPTDFKVLVFDTAGSRVSKDVSWKARGIV